jgi:hypothetical protein
MIRSGDVFFILETDGISSGIAWGMGTRTS